MSPRAYNQPDLFAETLLVELEGDQSFTTSLKIAAHYRKSHRHVLDSIQKIVQTEPEEVGNQPDFRLIRYLDARNRKQPMYRISRDGFYLLSFGFTGPEAMRWKRAFIAAFKFMEKVINAQQQREAAALHQLRPKWQVIASGVREGLSRAEIQAQTGHRSAASITANKRRMREVGLLS